MSLMPHDAIRAVAQTIGISSLGDDVTAALAPDVEYRMREIMQEAIKCMHHSKRTMLTAEDVNSALSLRNVEPLYGFASSDPLRFRRALGHSDLFYIDDRDLDFKEVLENQLPKAPLDVSVTAHWLAIEGVQPAIPENVPIRPLAPPAIDKKASLVPPTSEELVEIKPAVKHVLSRELQLYFEKITELIIAGGEGQLLGHALRSLATDAGLHPLVPYFTQFIQDEVTRSLEDFSLLFSLMRVVQSLLLNPHIHIDPYLHQLMPSVITCLAAKRLGGKELNRHWELRDFAASLIAFICKRFGEAYQDLQTRVTRTLLQAFLDPKRSIPQQYGAIRGLAALGPRVVRLLILPNLAPYLKVLQLELGREHRNEMKRYEALRAYAALQEAVGTCMLQRLKQNFPYPDILTSSRKNSRATRIMKDSSKAGKIVAPSRRKRVSEDVETANKRVKMFFADDIDSEFDSVNDSCVINSQSQQEVKVESGLSSHSQASTIVKGSEVDKSQKVDGKTDNFTKAWIDDGQDGHIWESLISMFGEALLPYVPAREVSITM